MRVLIVNFSRDWPSPPVVPVGVCSLAAATRAAGHYVSIADLTFSRYPDTAASHAVRDFKPDVVGISIRSLDNGNPSHPESILPQARDVVEACRRSGAGIIVAGGAAVTSLPGEVVRYLQADYGIMGAGETSFPALLNAIDTFIDPTPIPGVVVTDGEFAIASPPAPVSRAVSYPSSSPDTWLDLGKYLKQHIPMPVRMTRGTEEWRAYVPHWRQAGPVATIPPAAVAEAVARAQRLGFGAVEFVDQVFNGVPEHAVACCDAIARGGSSMKLQTMELDPARVSSDLVRSMNSAVFASVGIRVDSASEVMLQFLGKRATAKDYKRGCDQLRGLQASRMWLLTVGWPGETDWTLAETARFIESAIPKEDTVHVACGTRILPDTAVHEAAVSEGVIEPGVELLEPKIYFSRCTTPERAASIICGARFPSRNLVLSGFDMPRQTAYERAGRSEAATASWV